MSDKKSIIIGLTGSIGMGKSETAKIFERANIPVFDSDAAVHDLMTKNGAAFEPIEKTFPGVSGPDGIDRVALGARVFGDAEALQKLESILHPMVSEQRQAFFRQKQGHDLVVVDVPLLFEKGGEKNCDYVVVVTAPAEIQRQRVLARPHMTVEKFDQILAKQMPDGEKRQRADFIVYTDQGIPHAEQQVAEIITEIRAK